MEYILLKDVEQYLNQEVTLKGWIFNYRSSGGIYFLQFRDGTGLVQGVVVKNSVSPKVWEDCQKITLETSLTLTGKIKSEKRSPYGYEIEIKDLKLIQIAEEYPIGKKEHGPEFLMDQRHLWLRSSKQWAIQKVRNTIINATYEYFNQQGFTKIDAPILTPTACEGTTTLFEVDYFGKEKAYLSQSGQLYIEAAIFSHNRVFDFGPTFRAEKSKTRRHLTEFWMMDAEMAFAEHEENMKVQEDLIYHILQRVLEKNIEDLQILERDISFLEKIDKPFNRLTYKEAIKKLGELGSKIKLGEDLGAADETLLTKQYDRPIFVEKYPAQMKAFYMKHDPEDQDLALCDDLLAPEGYGEIIGGSQREDDYEILLKRMQDHKLPMKDFGWYLDLRKYGSVPHSGFGYGLERIVAWTCGLKHVRETIPFPRMLTRLRP
ncbi:MAG: asparagine--tRNA ligase [Patescibacteria group bacterium]|nr:asparagine--tRNA ligase [Patescibacteria group bacterium]